MHAVHGHVQRRRGAIGSGVLWGLVGRVKGPRVWIQECLCLKPAHGGCGEVRHLW